MLPPTLTASENAWSPIRCAILLLLGAIAIYNFVRRDATAFEWPAIDMGCFFERYQDPSFLTNDYFTNSVSQPNPRHIFGYSVIAVGRVIGTDWYGTFFALRCVTTVAFPMLWYLALWGMMRPRLASERAQLAATLALAVAMVLIMRQDVNRWFSIAWWPPYSIYVGAQPLSQLVGLSAIVLRTSGGRIGYPLSFVAWFCASLLHPAMALFLVVFYWLTMFNHSQWREIVADIFCTIVLPYGILLTLFRPATSLPTAEFIYYYAHVVHPFHYVVSEFETLTHHSWLWSFALVSTLLGAGCGLALWVETRQLARTALLFLLAYTGCVWLQYLGTEVWLSKSIVILGPARFSMLGYFMVAFVFSELAANDWPARLTRHSRQFKWVDRINWLRPTHVAAACVVAVVAMFGLLRDDLQSDIRGRYAGLYDWIERSTAPEDVFLTPFDLPLHRDLPIIGRRAVYASQSFPFSEGVWREHMRRWALAYGELSELESVSGKDLTRKRLQFGRQLSMADIARLAQEYRLDYVVIEAAKDSPLHSIEPCYCDASVKVYAVESMRKAEGQTKSSVAAGSNAHSVLPK